MESCISLRPRRESVAGRRAGNSYVQEEKFLPDERCPAADASAHTSEDACSRNDLEVIMKRNEVLTRWGLCLLVAMPSLVYGHNNVVTGRGTHAGGPSIFLPEHPPGGTAPDAGPSFGFQRPAPGEPIRILVLYTADAFAASNDPLAAVLAATSEINESFQRSGIAGSVELAHVLQSREVGSGNLWQDLKSLKDPGDGKFDQVQALRNDHLADVVMLISERADGCGVSFPHAAAENAYAVVQRTCMERNFTAAHELGHILGADHQRELKLNPYYVYGHGYQNIAEGVRSIMAFPCPAWNCERINVWSGPGEGGWLGNDLESNNRRVVSERAAIVAGFR
jgi:peptidyl-Asp metalloendopeptidase